METPPGHELVGAQGHGDQATSLVATNAVSERSGFRPPRPGVVPARPEPVRSHHQAATTRKPLPALPRHAAPAASTMAFSVLRVAGRPRHISSTLGDSSEDDDGDGAERYCEPISEPSRVRSSAAVHAIPRGDQITPSSSSPPIEPARGTAATTIPPILLNWTVQNPGKTPVPDTDNYDEWNLNQLRKECAMRKIRIPREKGNKISGESAEKRNRVHRLRKDDADRKAVEVAIDHENEQPVQLRKTKHCTPRLLNILFSDAFAMNFARLGDKASRHAIDEGDIKATSAFWKNVTIAFHTNTADFNELVCPDDVRLNELGIDPSQIRLHSTHRLIEMWKHVNQQYSKALSRFQQSGKHSSDFYSFAQGQADVLYLRLWLQRRPQLNSFVEGGLFDEDKSDSMSPRSGSKRTASVALGSNSKNGGNKWQQEIVKQMARVTDALLVQDQQSKTKDNHDDDDLSKTLDGLTKVHALIAQVEARIGNQSDNGQVAPTLARSLALYQRQLVVLERKLERFNDTI